MTVIDHVLSQHKSVALPNGFYTSHEVCDLTGATYRQINYWAAAGKLSLNGNAPECGSGFRLGYSLAVAVLVRAYVVASLVIDPSRVGGGIRIDSRFKSVPATLAALMTSDAQLTNCQLVIEPDSARIVHGDWPTDGALFVDLAACQRYVAEGIATS